MTVRSFVDSNVFVYAHDELARRKQLIATHLLRSLWVSGGALTSAQVINESVSALSKMFHGNENARCYTRSHATVLNLGDPGD